MNFEALNQPHHGARNHGYTASQSLRDCAGEDILLLVLELLNVTALIEVIYENTWSRKLQL